MTPTAATGGPAPHGPGPAGTPSGGLSADHIAALRPYVVNLTHGEFSTDGIMQTPQSDVDAIFDEHLPAFIDQAAKGATPTPVPLVIWAHGGVVSERAGLTIAGLQVPWWLANGAYPLHFVWETGFVETLQHLLGWRGGRDLAQGDADHATEFRSGPVSSGLWTSVKQSAARASGPGGGARYLGRRLARFCADNPGSVSLHAAGHSAGAIFHSHFIPAARAEGSPAFDSLQLLAPALRVDGFRTQLLPLVGSDIDKLTVFTMNMRAENDDNCFQVYRKSLLYLVSQMFETESGAPILGLEQSIRQDPELVAAFGLQPGVPGCANVIFSPTVVNAPPDSRSGATSHGGFDNDPDTMDSVARRIFGRTDIVQFPTPGRRTVRRGQTAARPAGAHTGALSAIGT